MEHQCPKHEPGAIGCYVRCHCRCTPCRRTKARSEKRSRVLGSTLRPAIGTHRRLQALGAIGWSMRAIGRQAGHTHAWAQAILAGESVSARVETDVRRLYDRLWNSPPPVATAHARAAAARTRNRAAASGWPPPLAWDDDHGTHGIDNPTATPHEWRRTERTTTSRDDVVELVELGASMASVMQRFGLSAYAIEQSLRRAGRVDLWAALVPRERGAA